MADLFDRLFSSSIEEPLPFSHAVDIRTFHAGFSDYVSGNTTRAQIISFMDLTGQEVTDLDVLLGAVDAISSAQGKLQWLTELRAVLELANAGIKYDTKSAFVARMGL
jgi:hypothetical protein